MKLLASPVFLVFATAVVSSAARCTTVMDSRVLQEYHAYVDNAERTMMSRFAGAELSWIPDGARKDAAAQITAGRPIRRNLSPAETNARIQNQNGTILDWIGAIKIRDTRLEDLRSILQGYARHASIYRPLIYASEARRGTASNDSFEVTYGLQNLYRAAAVFSQSYSFQVKMRADYSLTGDGGAQVLQVHSRSDDIRESDSGIPGRADFLEQYHDHGILWALNTYWRARASGPDLYVEFETITLARSVHEYMCKVGLLPIPKAVIANVMDALPSESVELMLTATKAECDRLAKGIR
jgi:hypothetical protein